MARLPPLETEDLPEEDRHLFGTYRDMDGEYTPHLRSPPPGYGDDRGDEPPRLYQALGHNPPILEGFRRMASTIRGHCGLSERRREIVIHTTARLLEAEYEWHQHVRLGLAGELDLDDILAISEGRSEAFAAPEAALIEYVSAFVSESVSAADHDALAAEFDDAEIVGIAMLAQFYLGLAHAIDALGVELGEEFVGWELERLDAP